MENIFIDKAIEEAEKAFEENEVPVGAVIVRNNQVIASAHNMKVSTKNPLNHAEMIAINDAIRKIGDWRLNECEMYITLEPCPMCAGAISQSRIKKIYIGTKSNISCNEKIITDILQNSEYYHKVDISYLNNEKCSLLLSEFFANKR